MSLAEKWLESLNATSDWIILDNLDEDRLKLKNNGEVVVENEHGTEFSLSDLSDEEIRIFEELID